MEALPGKLYLVPTPIGNLGDMTIRAIEVLKEADLILAEDTRTTGKLLSHYQVGTPQKSYHIHNEHKILDLVIKEIAQGRQIALVSDAGTPGISDPGFLLVREALAQNIDVEALPGPTALVPALLKSGFPTDRFCFEGFLPHKKGRKTRLEKLADEERTIVLYESPHRILKLFEQLADHLDPERRVSISRELTKLHEETLTGTIKEVHETLANRSTVKGEIVVVIEGKKG
jgi:16S rRNA (cytidine1402-2'-O)-methyltransferase